MLRASRELFSFIGSRTRFSSRNLHGTCLTVYILRQRINYLRKLFGLNTGDSTNPLRALRGEGSKIGPCDGKSTSKCTGSDPLHTSSTSDWIGNDEIDEIDESDGAKSTTSVRIGISITSGNRIPSFSFGLRCRFQRNRIKQNIPKMKTSEIVEINPPRNRELVQRDDDSTKQKIKKNV